MNTLRISLVAATALCGAALASGSASALPINGIAPLAGGIAANVENVRWVCGPYRCWWRPNYYVGPRVYGYGYGPRHFFRDRDRDDRRFHGERERGERR